MAAIRLSASVVLLPEQSAVKYARNEASRDAESASASPGVNSKAFTSFTCMLSTSPLGAPQQSVYFLPEPHSQGSLRPVLPPIVPLRLGNCNPSPRRANNPRRQSVASAHGGDYRSGIRLAHCYRTTVHLVGSVGWGFGDRSLPFTTRDPMRSV